MAHTIGMLHSRSPKDKRVQAHEVEGEEVEQCDGGHEPLPRIGHPLSPITVYAVHTHKSSCLIVTDVAKT